MSTVIFETTEEQRQLRGTLRDLFASRATSAAVRRAMLENAGADDTLWAELAGLGLVGLAVPEEYGGGGASAVEVCILLEEAGRRLAPVPLLSTSVLGVTLLAACGSTDHRSAVLPLVASGAIRLAVAYLDEQGRAGQPPSVQAAADGGHWVLRGTAGYVIDGLGAGVIVTAARAPDGLGLFLVPADAVGLTRTPIPVLDLTRPMATVTFDGVKVDSASRLTGDAEASLATALTAGVIALASEQVGATDEVLAMTTAYARQRVQFGRAIGSFQAVKHGLADGLMRLEASRSVALHAARSLAVGDAQELAIAAPMAGAYCGEIFEDIAADALQFHGGVGFTWEHDVHLYYKRAKSSKLLFGGPHHHRRALGDALGF